MTLAVIDKRRSVRNVTMGLSCSSNREKPVAGRRCRRHMGAMPDRCEDHQQDNEHAGRAAQQRPPKVPRRKGHATHRVHRKREEGYEVKRSAMTGRGRRRPSVEANRWPADG